MERLGLDCVDPLCSGIGYAGLSPSDLAVIFPYSVLLGDYRRIPESGILGLYRERMADLMNVVLLLIVISQVCLGVCAWRSPECLRWLASHFLARADAVDAAREVAERRLRFWRSELGLDRALPPDEVRPAMPKLARR